jgi:5-oxoprolinase (ATP-hydrolysing) subunit A
MKSIDLNCDLGEGFGIYQVAPEEKIFPRITSANIACGFHAGSPLIMQRSVALAVRHGVAIGAHPGTPDLEGFGRRRLEMSSEALESAVIYQVGALEGMVRASGSRLTHVKPHGWLYNEACQDEQTARTVVSAIRKFSCRLVLFGLPESALVRCAREAGIPCASEAFMDRRYLDNGYLVPRGNPRALITDPVEAAEQALYLVQEGKVRSANGSAIPVQADTLCVHGDNPEVLAILDRVRDVMDKHGIPVRSYCAEV